MWESLLPGMHFHSFKNNGVGLFPTQNINCLGLFSKFSRRWKLDKTRPSKMEIYHRDNWIIIVHMATWKDLTKWNEENTIMNWINHMERIVKCVFPVPSRFQREGHTSEKYYMVYYVLSLISLYQVSNSRYQAVPGYAWLYLAVLGCTRLYMAVPGCSWLHLAVPGCTWLYYAVLG